MNKFLMKYEGAILLTWYSILTTLMVLGAWKAFELILMVVGK